MGYDTEAVTVALGCIAASTNNCDDVWVRIGADWAVSRSLVHAAEDETGQQFVDAAKA